MDFLRERLKYILIAVPLILLLIVGIFFLVRFIRNRDSAEPQQIELTYWGLFEPPEVILPLIDEYETLFEQENPGSTITINYEQRFYDSLEQYREATLTRFSTGEGPDIVRIHSTWVPQFSSHLSPLPSEVMTVEEYGNTFYRIASEQATVDGNIYAIPTMYDGLVLLVNSDLFNEAGLAVPKVDDRLTWFEFEELAKALTKRSGNRITQAGAAIGTAENIPHATDILGLMMAQVGVTNVEGLSSVGAADALQLYADFSRDAKVWDESFLTSVDTFINGNVAMIFVPSWRVHAIRELNPGLRMEATAIPQTPSTTQRSVNWASFWMEGVSNDSSHAEVAWDFLSFLSSADAQKESYSRATQLRKFGAPYSRVDLAPNLASHEILGPLVAGAPTATTWYIADWSGNQQFVEILTKAMVAAERGQSAGPELIKAQGTLDQLAKQQGVVR